MELDCIEKSSASCTKPKKSCQKTTVDSRRPERSCGHSDTEVTSDERRNSSTSTSGREAATIPLLKREAPLPTWGAEKEQVAAALEALETVATVTTTMLLRTAPKAFLATPLATWLTASLKTIPVVLLKMRLWLRTHLLRNYQIKRIKPSKGTSMLLRKKMLAHRAQLSLTRNGPRRRMCALSADRFIWVNFGEETQGAKRRFSLTSFAKVR